MILKRAAIPMLGMAILLSAGGSALASSHREAPFVTKMPKVDGTDLYMFRSYEAGRSGFVTIIADYQPFQDPYGGPNYFFLDPEAMYEIHIDNNGDAVEDLTFQFRPQLDFKNIALPIGEAGAEVTNSVPVYNTGPIDGLDPANLNIEEDYTLTLVRGPRRTGTATPVMNGSVSTFDKPADYVGTKSIADYAAYAQAHIFNINVPGCDDTGGRVFVGQRDEPFIVAVGEIFDLINVPLAQVTGQDPGCQDPANDDLDGKNITTFALEVPIGCLVADGGADPVIGAWTTASVRQARVINPSPSFDNPAVYGGPWAQVSRLGHPLVNEVIIGLADKDRFNTSHPSDDAQFAQYVTHPVLPEYVELIFGAEVGGDVAPNVFPRQDLVDVFLLGIEGVNRPAGSPVPSEQLRLNTSIEATAAGSQNPLGVLGGDNAGFPNGRRPIDDVVDIELRVAMGALLPDPGTETNPTGALAFTDCAPTQAGDYLDQFPYIATPIPGSAAD